MTKLGNKLVTDLLNKQGIEDSAANKFAILNSLGWSNKPRIVGQIIRWEGKRVGQAMIKLGTGLMGLLLASDEALKDLGMSVDDIRKYDEIQNPVLEQDIDFYLRRNSRR